MTTATHWIPEDVDFEDSDNFPIADPLEAAMEYVQLIDGEGRESLLDQGTVLIELRGCYETNEPIPDPDDQFDGYALGSTYWKYTTERKRVRLTITATIEN